MTKPAPKSPVEWYRADSDLYFGDDCAHRAGWRISADAVHRNGWQSQCTPLPAPSPGDIPEEKEQ